MADDQDDDRMAGHRRIAVLWAEYRALAHAVQTGTALELSRKPDSGTPKHLRTGVNLAMRDAASLAKLLVDKGVISEDEYVAALVNGLRDEVDTIHRRLGLPPTAKIL